MKKIVIFGAGGHGKVIYDILKLRNEVKILGFIDDSKEKGESILDSIVVGNKQDLKRLASEGKVQGAIVALAGVKGANQIRENLNNLLRGWGLEIVGAIHPSAKISPYAKIHPTVQICGHTWIGPASELGEGTIVNTGAQIDHDNNVGKYVHVAPGAKLMGIVTVGDYSYIGASSTVRETKVVGKEVLVVMGSVVVKDVADNTKVKGVPAKEY